MAGKRADNTYHTFRAASQWWQRATGREIREPIQSCQLRLTHLLK
jgi:hypothetical protein